jgi:hypothetical protein
MTKAAWIVASLALPLALAACSQHDAPSDSIKNAADQIVGKVDGSTPAAKLADGRFAPRDECADLPGATNFRQQLAAAVKAKDADALAALAAPDVRLDFGNTSGTGELREKLLQSDWSLWDELVPILSMGCATNDQGGITLPWYAAQPLDGLDPDTGMIVIAEKVPLYQSPDAKSPVLDRLSWDGVTLLGGLQPEDPFQKVKAADGKVGFVATDKLRSLLDYRLIASSRDGKWSFTSLIAGD